MGTIAALGAVAALGGPVGEAAAQSRKVPEQLIAAAAQGGHQRVIVLMAPNRQESARAPEAYLESALGPSARAIERIGDAPFVVAEVSGAALTRLAGDPNVERVVPDRLMQALLPDSTRMLHVPEAWGAGGTGAGVSVAVLDTGVARAHPFFAGRIVAEACFSSTSAAAGSKSLCPGGRSEAIGPGAGDACDIRAVTPNCVHGTHVAGIAAGANGRSPDGRLDGVAPGAGVVAVQVFSRFDGEQRCGKGVTTCISAFTSDVLKGLLYVESIRAQAKVAAVNLSLGGGKATEACDAQSPYAQVIDRLTAAGLPVVAASGNNGFADAVTEPACIRSAVTVGALDKTGRIATAYSNASPMVDLVAPGTQILSAAGGGYHRLDGTSMAAPHVAGLLALMKARQPDAPVATLLEAIRASGASVADPRNRATFVMPVADAALRALTGAPKPDPAPGAPPPDPKIGGCGPVCVENRRVIFALAERGRVPAPTLAALRALFGPNAKIEDIGDGRLLVELPEGATGDDVDRARRDMGGDARAFPDRPLDALPPGGRIEIR
ncbi:S8 family serine peptidase [Methylopila musalis]|uniref:S8 family serine peptidase n=1 Tax=Methylopila musalis TaxID=1134781 RepID=A0ABW3ZB97_9HYPH